MMKNSYLIVLVLFLFVRGLSAQESEKQMGIKFSGFIKTDFFYDTRQSSASTGLREGHFYLYPDNVLYDSEGHDLNASPSFHMLNIQTRLKGDISGPDAFGAKTSGTIEAEFFGTNESDINGFRLRHAFLKLDWDKVSLIAGQNWHPLFLTESFPGTISFNTGAPFTPFSRNPQVRLTMKAGKSSIQMAAYSQRDFVSSGPDGSSNKYIRNSGIPGLDLQLKIPAGSAVSLWGGVDYKVIRPELRTVTNYLTKEKLGSLVLFSNLKIKTTSVTMSLMGTYAQNATDLIMLGGYAVSQTTDLLRMYREYTTLNSASFWFDMSTNGTSFSFGLFAGYAKNLGASDEITGPVYARGGNIDNIFRVSPRMTFTSGKVSFATELETTSAAYGIMDTNGTVNDAKSVTNIRLLFATFYRF